MSKLDEYMNQVFSELQLKSPLFYSSPIGIRFDLDGHFFANYSKDELEKVLARINLFTQALYTGEDNLILVFFASAEEDASFSSYETTLSVALEKAIVESVKVKVIKTMHPNRYDEDEDCVTYRYEIQCKRALVNFEELYRFQWLEVDGTVHSYGTGDFFIVNTSKDTIFHVYDERGADLIAKEKESIRPIYESFKDLVLEYDLEAIQSLFEGNNKK